MVHIVFERWCVCVGVRQMVDVKKSSLKKDLSTASVLDGITNVALETKKKKKIL